MYILPICTKNKLIANKIWVKFVDVDTYSNSFTITDQPMKTINSNNVYYIEVPTTSQRVFASPTRCIIYIYTIKPRTSQPSGIEARYPFE